MKKILSLLSFVALVCHTSHAQKVSALSNAGILSSNALFSVSIFSGGVTNTKQISWGQMQQQLKDEVNVVDYGATAYIPPSITSGSYITNPPADSSAAIQAAMNAAFASGGKSNMVYFPKGIYAIGTNIFVPPGISVRGVGTLHAGDFADAVTRLNTNAYSIVWQTNLNRGGLVFNNLDKKGSRAYFIEVCGFTNPLAGGDAGPLNFADARSADIGNGPGVFLGRESITDWDGAATNGGYGYAGDFQGYGLVTSGWKLGIRCTANSVNFLRCHGVGCDTWFANSDVCCGGDQTHFDSCSASMRPNGIGYRYAQGGGNRGITYTTPGDYELGTWIIGTNFTMTARGGNLEFTHANSALTNFIESWGNNHIVLEGMRIQFPVYANANVFHCLINNSYTAVNEYGPLGEITGCQVDIHAYTNLAMNGGVTNSSGAVPLLLRVGPYYQGGFKAGGGTRGWVEVLNGSRVPVFTYMLNADASFAPPLSQPIIFGGAAWNNAGGGGNLPAQYGVPWVIKGTPDYMEVWLAKTAAGPLGHARVMLSDISTSTSAAAANNLTLAGLIADAMTNTTILTKIIGTDANGKHKGATLGSGLAWDGTTLSVSGTGGDVLGGVSATTWLSLATNEIYFTGSPNYSMNLYDGSGLVGIRLDYNNEIYMAAPQIRMSANLLVSGTITASGGLAGDASAATGYSANNVVSTSASWSYSSNTLALNNGFTVLQVGTDCAVTNLSGGVASQEKWGTLVVSNSSAGSIVARNTVGATARLQGTEANNAVTIGAGKMAYLKFQILNGTLGATNYWSTVQQ
jgi:hypothetical protein